MFNKIKKSNATIKSPTLGNIFLVKAPNCPKWSQYKISKYLGIDRNTVQNWVKRYEETGDVQDLEGRGRNRKTLNNIDKKIIKLFEKDDTMTLSRARAFLEKKNLHLSISTTSRRLHEAGFFSKSTTFKTTSQF